MAFVKETRLLSEDMQQTMNKFIKIETLVEEILSLKQQISEYDQKKALNKDCQSAFTQGKIQANNKLWMSYGDLMIKLPRKNLVNLVESDQVKLTKAIGDAKAEIKKKIKELTDLNPQIEDVDPIVARMILKEMIMEQKKKEGLIIEEEDEEDSD